jgi:alpha-L-rhamnosidase
MTLGVDRREFIIVGAAACGLAPRSLLSAESRVRPVGLKVDYMDRPLSLQNRSPRLSWRLESDARNVKQSAYRVLVASNRDLLDGHQGDLWDSGRVASRRSFGIQYCGRQLCSRQRCWWKVQVWDEINDRSAFSAPSVWEMGLLSPKDWIAQWLAVEDHVARADREFGLRWIWGKPSCERGTRHFRLKVELPRPSLAGELIVVVNDWNLWTQISRICVDGTLAAGPGRWIDDIGPETGRLSRERLTLPPMNTGNHVIAVEVNTADLSPLLAESEYVHGLALFARFHLPSDEILRFGSGPHCKTRLAPSSDIEWHTVNYNDTGWEHARPVSIDSYQPWPAQPAMYLRRLFSLTQPVVAARLYVTALGGYEARLNGQRVGDALLTPEVSQYGKRVLYQTYDVSALLKTGQNALGLLVGDGWYGSFDGRFAWGLPPRRVLAQLELNFVDGSRQVVTTGSGWRMAESPIRASELRVGEVHDARLEQLGWDTDSFDDAHWSEVQIADSSPSHLVAQISPPIRATQILAPRAITQPKPGVYVFDFGQNFAGWCRLRVKGAAGLRIELRFSELLTGSGEVDSGYTRGNMGEPKRDIFILRGEASEEMFEPHFTYRGFRYVQLTGLPTAPTVGSLEGIVVHSDLQVTGRLHCDVPLIQKIWRNTLWTQRSNFVAIPTDCPSREQRGWMGDSGIFWDAAAFNMDVCALTARHMEDVVDNQASDGAFPTVAPEPHHNNANFFVSGSAPGWSDAGVILPWTVWRRYGDTAVIEQHWGAMDRYLNFILENNPDYIWRNKRVDIGDHLALDEISPPGTAPATSCELLATAYWAHSADLLAQMAQAIGRNHDESRLRALFERIRQAFNVAYVRPDGSVGNATQTSQVLALSFGLLPQEIRSAAATKLADDIRRRGVSLTTGIVGSQFILDVLADTGFVDLAYGLLLRTEYPSWGYMVLQGATTIWESWSGKIGYDTNAIEWSHNHFALGAVSGFLFRRLAGIDAAAPGFEGIVLRPVLDLQIKRGGADYDSVMGRISTNWSQGPDGSFSLDVAIPANTSARIHLPARQGRLIWENRRDIVGRKDVRLIQRSAREAVLEVGSGSYRFETFT